MTTTTDIANRVIQTIGLQKRISGLTQDSAEAQAVALSFGPILDWCLGLTNWNFARATAILTMTKGPPPANPAAWTPIYPAPPWLYEYSLPTDFIRAWYMTNNTVNGPTWIGEPKRFVLGVSVVALAQQQVLLTNEPAATLIYTTRINDPNLWRWYFERLFVMALARAICMALSGDSRLYQELSTDLEQQINIAVQANTAEGLIIEDSTPEWIQAIGIDYPYRRINGATQMLNGGNRPAGRNNDNNN